MTRQFLETFLNKFPEMQVYNEDGPLVQISFRWPNHWIENENANIPREEFEEFYKTSTNYPLETSMWDLGTGAEIVNLRACSIKAWIYKSTGRYKEGQIEVVENVRKSSGKIVKKKHREIIPSDSVLAEILVDWNPLKPISEETTPHLPDL